MDVESMQPSIVIKEFRRVLTDKYQISKDARDSIVLSTNIFIHYITAAACEAARKQKKSTLQPVHVMKALEVCGFDDMVPEIEAFVQSV